MSSNGPSNPPAGSTQVGALMEALELQGVMLHRFKGTRGLYGALVIPVRAILDGAKGERNEPQVAIEACGIPALIDNGDGTYLLTATIKVSTVPVLVPLQVPPSPAARQETPEVVGAAS